MGEAQFTPGPRNAITDVKGIRVGQYSDRKGGTGCTVVLCEESDAAAVDVRGGAPGTRETDVLAPANLVRKCHAVVFAGGSAFGLASADGVMRYFAERDIGFPTAHRKVPIVSAAVVYDLGVKSSTAFPNADAGYLAASRARGGAVAEGSVGAGTGASVAKLLGAERSSPGGVGTASAVGPRGIVVGALVVSNAVGSFFEPQTGECVVGPRGDDGRPLPLAEAIVRRTAEMDALLENTTLMCVATNAKLAPHQLQRLAMQAHDGFARVVAPAHTFGDGDSAFVVSMGQLPIQDDESLLLGMLTSHAIERALLRSVRKRGQAPGRASGGPSSRAGGRRLSATR
jgi:L-aminopeptidase/D-esterase-like protein